MYVCLCNALTDEKVRSTASQGTTRLRDLYAVCGCQAQCGTCARTLLAILRETRPAEAGAR